MGGGSRGRKDAVYSALKSLMEEPGAPHEILADLSYSLASGKEKIAKLLAGTAAKYDDRSAAIAFAGMLESALEIAVASHFIISDTQSRRLFSYPDGPLKDFAAKIAMGLALGVYDWQMHSDLTWVQRIRNTFAHARTDVTFETTAIRNACDQLRFPSKESQVTKTSRQRFTACVGVITGTLETHKYDKAIKLAGTATYLAMYPPAPAPST